MRYRVERILAVLLAVTMVISMVPETVFAAGLETGYEDDSVYDESELSEEQSATAEEEIEIFEDEQEENVEELPASEEEISEDDSNFEEEISEDNVDFEAEISEDVVDLEEEITEEVVDSDEVISEDVEDSEEEISEEPADSEETSKEQIDSEEEISEDEIAEETTQDAEINEELVSMAIPDGSCGKNAKWIIDEYGTLTIFGTGAMDDFDDIDNVPWVIFVETGRVEEIVIEEGITSIGDYAFSGCTGIHSINLPSSMKSIGWYSFANCTNLETVFIPNGVTSIGYSAFMNTGLEKATIPDSVKNLDGVVFSGCSKLKTVSIPGSISAISDYTFYECTSLESVSLGYGVKSIGESAFGNCGSDKLRIFLPDTLKTIDSYAFYGSTINEMIIPYSLEYVGKYAFGVANINKILYLGSYDQWEKLEIEEGNEALFNAAEFSYGSNIVRTGSVNEDISYEIRFDGSMTISGTGEMPEILNSNDVPWNDCADAITSVVIEEGITSVCNFAFYEMKNLKSVSIPDTVEYIGAYAFYECIKLEKVIIPDGVSVISNNCFEDCVELKSIKLPNSMKEIYEKAFMYCASLSDICLPKGIEYIGESAFYGCESLKSIEWPSNCAKMLPGTFCNCTSLYSVSLPAQIDVSKGAAFTGYHSLKRIIYDGDFVQWQDQFAGFTDDDRAALGSVVAIQCKPVNVSGKLGSNLTYTIKGGVLTISGKGPMENKGDEMTGWHRYLEYGLISKVVIKKGVTSISYEAFYDGYSITDVSIPNTVKTIEQRAFYGCNSLTSVSIPNSVTEIGEGAFRNCESLQEVKLPKKLKSIAPSLFERDPELSSVNIPDTVTEIGEYAFYKCAKLKSVKVPKSATAIGKRAFEECGELSEVVLSEGVTQIGFCAFFNCRKLKYLSLPKSLISIANKAFGGCESIDKVCYPGTMDEFNKITKTTELDTFIHPGNLVCGGGVNVYKVEFDTQGAEQSFDDVWLSVGEEYVIPDYTYSKTGYILNGWKCGKKVYKAGDKVKNLSTKNGAVVKLVAQWTPDKNSSYYNYVIKFDGNNENSGTMKDLSMQVGTSKKLTANAFTKADNHFMGWGFEPDSDEVIFTDKQSVKDVTEALARFYNYQFEAPGEVKLYAIWEQNLYTITYNGNGGKLSNGSKTCTQTMTAGQIDMLDKNAFTRKGYTFMGWSTNKKATAPMYEDRESVIESLSSKNKGKVTLYAVWKLNSYNIQFMAGGLKEINADGVTSTMVAPFNKSIKLVSCNFELPGYYFAGWKCSNGKTYKDGASVKNLTSVNGRTVIMTATWKKNEYTVKYNKNGASGTVPASVKVPKDGTKVVIQAGSSLKFGGKTFVGWNSKPDSSGRWYTEGESYAMSDKDVKYKKTLTLYAVWGYEIMLDSGYKENSASYPCAVFWNRAEKIDNPGFTKVGYKLAGWNTDKTKAAKGVALKTIKNLKEGATLYAVWKPITYKIVFVNNDPNYSFEPVYQTMTYDKAAALKANTFKMKGYKFDKWVRNIDGEHYEYFDDKQVVENLSATEGDEIELLATYTPIE